MARTYLEMIVPWSEPLRRRLRITVKPNIRFCKTVSLITVFDKNTKPN